ncbi:MAG TPA: hypothetical protein VG028_09580 [Terriglobia bacterium]|nr:hypothetical protein [Terriglobia bacterium]
MNNQSPVKRIIIGALVLLVGAISLTAQEPSPTPPPPGWARGDVLFFGGMEDASSAKAVQGSPYSAQAVTEMDQTLSDGNQIHHKTTATVYRDSEGRTRRELTLGGFGPWSVPANKTKQIIRINDPVAGVRYVLIPDQRIAQKLPPLGGRRRMFRQRFLRSGMPPQPGQGDMKFRTGGPVPPDGGEGPVAITMAGGEEGPRTIAIEGGPPEAGNVKTESLGSQVIEGVQADGMRRTVTIPAGRIGNDKPIQIVTERWYSSQLQAVVLSKRSDPRVGETTYRLTNISQAEPAATLFQIPAGYTVKDAPPLKDGPPLRGQSPDAKPEANQ